MLPYCFMNFGLGNSEEHNVLISGVEKKINYIHCKICIWYIVPKQKENITYKHNIILLHL